MVDVARHPNIELLTYSEVENIDGYVGNFKVRIRKKARSIDENKCTGCEECVSHCIVRNTPKIPEVPSIRNKLKDEDRKKLDAIFKKYEGEEGSLIPVLQDINSEYNYLPEDALKYTAEKLDTHLSQVYHVATFYTAFSLTPRGKHILKVCLGTACHVRGGSRVLSEIERHLNIKPGETTSDKKYTLETVNCLGCCALGPVVVIDDEYHMITPDKVETFLKKYDSPRKEVIT